MAPAANLRLFVKLDDSTVQLTLEQGPAARRPLAENPVHFPEGKGCVCWWGGIPSQPLKGLEGLVGGVVGAALCGGAAQAIAGAGSGQGAPGPSPSATPDPATRAPLRLGVGQDAAVTTQQLRGAAGVKGARLS